MYKDIALVIFIVAVFAVIANAQNVDLSGTWRTGGMSTMGDRNTVTGSVTPSNGNTMKYEFRPDGRFAFVGYLQSTLYGCTTALFQDKQGKYSLAGSRLTLALTKNFWRNTYSCSPASNKERITRWNPKFTRFETRPMSTASFTSALRTRKAKPATAARTNNTRHKRKECPGNHSGHFFSEQ